MNKIILVALAILFALVSSKWIWIEEDHYEEEETQTLGMKLGSTVTTIPTIAAYENGADSRNQAYFRIVSPVAGKTDTFNVISMPSGAGAPRDFSIGPNVFYLVSQTGNLFQLKNNKWTMVSGMTNIRKVHTNCLGELYVLKDYTIYKVVNNALQAISDNKYLFVTGYGDYLYAVGSGDNSLYMRVPNTNTWEKVVSGIVSGGIVNGVSVQCKTTPGEPAIVAVESKFGTFIRHKAADASTYETIPFDGKSPTSIKYGTDGTIAFIEFNTGVLWTYKSGTWTKYDSANLKIILAVA